MNIAPGRASRLMLACVPFVLLALVYVVGSAERRAANPDDKLLPPVSEMADAVRRVAFEPDRRTGEYVLWADTAASLQRLGLGLGIATLIGLVLGVAIGILPFVRAAFAPLVAVICMVPPMAILPVLFIVFGLGELSKVVLILIGVAPFLVRDLAFAVDKLPVEQIVKAQSLGASTWQVAIRVVLPQVMPRLIEAVRLSLGPAFLFLISAEAIAADSGLGYRIFLVRRYLAMDTILPYVAWITLLAYAMDFALARIARAALPVGLCDRAAVMSAITVRNVWVEYGDQIVLERINLEIAAGAFVSIVGPSGCGKSTFLRLILGQERPTAGHDPARRRAHAGRARPRPRRRVPALFGVPPSHGAGQRAGRVRVRGEPGAGAAYRRGAARCHREERRRYRSGRPRRPTATSTRARYRAACSSASRSPRRSRASRACSCSTSRSARSIPARARRCMR